MRFPLPSPGEVRFTIFHYPKPDAPRFGSRDDKFYDSGHCFGCDRENLWTCRVEGFPSLCKDCYSIVYKYSNFYEDPCGLKKLKKGTEIDVALTKEVIRQGKRMLKIKQLVISGLVYDYVYGNHKK